ncbi:hypothetical protein C942_00466 [Photobacterium marinum]|uniref:Uncharacterized protein n=1 Tax=Photobacterium marinum TaxID=1056511 RepID=L8JER8_9GAMM|nr:hypothetical protein C942_00466 [Photobacterium marinum]
MLAKLFVAGGLHQPDVNCDKPIGALGCSCWRCFFYLVT